MASGKHLALNPEACKRHCVRRSAMKIADEELAALVSVTDFLLNGEAEDPHGSHGLLLRVLNVEEFIENIEKARKLLDRLHSEMIGA
jgi:hypothetical protein